MRIAVFHDDCGDPGGANTYRAHLCSLLEERGHEIFLFTYRGAKGMEKDSHVTIYVPGGPRRVGGRLVHHRLPHCKVTGAVRRWLLDIEPDILHLHTNYAFTSSVLLGIGKITPAVQTVHDFRLVCPTERAVTPAGRLCGGGVSRDCVADRCISSKRYLLEVLHRKVQRPLYSRAVYRFIAPSEALRSSMEKEGFPSVHIPHYADTTSTCPQPPDREKNLVLFVGYLHYGKGVDILLRAFKEVRKDVPSSRLLIAGNGPAEEELRALYRKLNLGEAVRFLGEVPEDRIPELYRRSSFVVLPSIIYENSPLIIYEAMAFGRAVVGTRIGGIPELVEDGETGFLFERNDISDLVSKIVTLLKNDALTERLGAAGRKRAETEFTIEKHLDSILDLYDSARGTVP
jgi:glycosyltransferase involved in cell wall biosynthesis